MADLSITVANVLASTAGQKLQATAAAGVTITAGQYIVVDASNLAYLADSNGSPPLNGCSGVALNGASPGQPVDYVGKDSGFTFGGTAVSGDVLYLSDTPGAVTKTYADIASGSTVITLGAMTSTTVLNLNITVGGTK